MQQVFKTPNSIKENSCFTFCPGCDHGVVIKLVAQLLDELNLQEDTEITVQHILAVYFQLEVNRI